MGNVRRGAAGVVDMDTQSMDANGDQKTAGWCTSLNQGGRA